jgi:hypothetical protein
MARKKSPERRAPRARLRLTSPYNRPSGRISTASASGLAKDAGNAIAKATLTGKF